MANYSTCHWQVADAQEREVLKQPADGENRMGVVLTMLSRKGGCGKTSLTINLAAAFAAEGLRVSVVDFDAQCSLTQFYLGSENSERLQPEGTVATLFASGKSVQIARETSSENVTVLPGHFDLDVPRDVTPNLQQEGIDLTIIDTPPDVRSPVVRAALMVSDFVLCPVLPEAFGVQAIASIQNILSSVALASNTRLHLLGYAINMRQRLGVHTAIEELLRRLHGEQILSTVLPHLVVFKEAIAASQSVLDYAPKSSAAEATRTLCLEVLSRIERIGTEEGSAAA